MSNKEFDDWLVETGPAAKAEARSEVRAQEKILDLWKSGKTYDEAVKVLQSGVQNSERPTMNHC